MYLEKDELTKNQKIDTHEVLQDFYLVNLSRQLVFLAVAKFITDERILAFLVMEKK